MAASESAASAALSLQALPLEMIEHVMLQLAPDWTSLKKARLVCRVFRCAVEGAMRQALLQHGVLVFSPPLQCWILSLMLKLPRLKETPEVFIDGSPCEKAVANALSIPQGYVLSALAQRQKKQTARKTRGIRRPLWRSWQSS